MKMLTIALVALTLIGAGVIAVPGAEASECSSSPPLDCPPGSIPWRDGSKNCNGGWTCAYLW